MKIFDLSRTIENDMAVYEGDPTVKIGQLKRIEADKFNLSGISFGSHTGTHCDAYAHFIKGGDGIDEIGLEHFVGQAVVVFARVENGIINCDDIISGLERAEGAKILLVKTEWSEREFDKAFFENAPKLSDYIGRELSQRGIISIGVDTPSVECAKDNSPMKTHIDLLGRKITIIENLKLSQLEEGTYFFSSAPLKIAGCDGSPCRAYCVRF